VGFLFQASHDREEKTILSSLRQVHVRVHRAALIAQFKVQVWAGGVACGTCSAQEFPLAYLLPDFYHNLG
jgi:hypothetical protein